MTKYGNRPQLYLITDNFALQTDGHDIFSHSHKLLWQYLIFLNCDLFFFRIQEQHLQFLCTIQILKKTIFTITCFDQLYASMLNKSVIFFNQNPKFWPLLLPNAK